MGNIHYYKPERNNYFFGKLMSVRDFKNEQNYFKSKRHLLTKMLGGIGIISGLAVILIDNRTFSLETGLAIDYLGREIMVSEPCVRKLNVIKGYSECKNSNVIYLGISYKEDLTESTFSINSSSEAEGSGKQYNRIRESYELFLTSEVPAEHDLTLDSLVYIYTDIYNQNGIKIKLVSPKYANPASNINLKLHFEKEKIEELVTYELELTGSLFKDPKNHNQDSIIMSHTTREIKNYKHIKQDYTMYCDAQQKAITNIIIPKDKFKLTKGEEQFTLGSDISIPIQIVNEKLSDILIKDYYSQNFDELIELVDNKHIYLAKFNVVNNKSTYFIDQFENHPFKQYLYSNSLLKLLTEIKSIEHSQNQPDLEETASNTNQTNKQPELTNNQFSALNTPKELPKSNIYTGIERINLGFNVKPGNLYYSYEFVHGLGTGEVGVSVATINHTNIELYEKNLLIFGDKSIFNKSDLKMSTPNVQIGALLDPHKGTLRLGIRALEKTNNQYIDIRWWVYKPLENPADDEDLALDQDINLEITPNTVSIKPLEQVRFEATITGTNDQRIRWELTQNNSGNIDANGLYTAPGTESVYEIRAFSVHMPNISSTAYVVVSSNTIITAGTPIPFNSINPTKPASDSKTEAKASPQPPAQEPADTDPEKPDNPETTPDSNPDTKADDDNTPDNNSPNKPDLAPQPEPNQQIEENKPPI
ncbi:MAG: hypothetical protein NkDv07_0710 [Candidatus Improbicoccus devescovinae]|nr:MAG: hypothetical protein NkDv07_0710 [Candidatus Improbicoccus devescovinae]